MHTLNAKLTAHRLALAHYPALASGSRRADRVQFEFDENWEGLSRVALFWGDGAEAEAAPYAVAVDDAGCAVIPYEVLKEAAHIRFGVYGLDSAGTTRITSTLVRYRVETGAWSEDPANPGEPTLTLIEQFEAAAWAAIQQARTIADDAARYAEACVEAEESARAAAQSAQGAGTAATLAESWAVGGTGAREGEDADNARHYAQLARQGAEASGYAWFDIDDGTGEMRVTVTDNLAADVAFSIDENTGILEVNVNG